MRQAFKIIIILIILLFLTYSTILALSPKRYTYIPSNLPSNGVYKVHEGQNLWSIGKSLLEPKSDVRAWMYDVVELNKIKNANSLSIGQELILP